MPPKAVMTAPNGSDREAERVTPDKSSHAVKNATPVDNHHRGETVALTGDPRGTAVSEEEARMSWIVSARSIPAPSQRRGGTEGPGAASAGTAHPARRKTVTVAGTNLGREK